MTVRRASIGAVAVALVVPAGANAAGFGEPQPIPGSRQLVGPEVAMAPDGRLAIVAMKERRLGKGRVASEFVALVSNPAGTFAAPQRLGGAPDYDRYNLGLTLVARPDGGLVACYLQSKPKRRVSLGCRIAAPGSTSFGRFRPLLTARASAGPSIEVAVRPDSTTAMLATVYGRTAKETLYIVDAAGTKRSATPVISPPTHGEAFGGSMRAYPDGSLAIPVRLPIVGKKTGSTPGIRIAPPGSTSFGATVAVGNETVDGGPVSLEGTYAPRLVYSVAPTGSQTEPQTHILQRRPDGSWRGPIALPTSYGSEGPTTGEGPILDFPGGELMLIVGDVRHPEDLPNCLQARGSRVSAGPLGDPVSPFPAGAQVLRDGQMGLSVDAAPLVDGTVVAKWEDAMSDEADVRVEVAVREPGATSFGVQPLPVPAWQETTMLATGGAQAAVVWAETEMRRARYARLFVSRLRTAAPYATPAALPAKPVATCDD